MIKNPAAGDRVWNILKNYTKYDAYSLTWNILNFLYFIIPKPQWEKFRLRVCHMYTCEKVENPIVLTWNWPLLWPQIGLCNGPNNHENYLYLYYGPVKTKWNSSQFNGKTQSNDPKTVKFSLGLFSLFWPKTLKFFSATPSGVSPKTMNFYRWQFFKDCFVNKVIFL